MTKAYKELLALKKEWEPYINEVDRDVWKPIDGFDGYSIAECGCILREHRERYFRGLKCSYLPIIMKPKFDELGYSRIILRKNGKSYTFLVHRVNAITWLSNDKNMPVVNHKNPFWKSPHISNLEWTTTQGNVDHAVSHGLVGKGETHVQSKLILDTETGIFYFGVPEAAYHKSTSKIQLYKKLCGFKRNNTSLIYV